MSLKLNSFINGDGRAECELINEARHIRNVFDVLPDPIYVKDMKRQFTLCNEAAARMFGLENPDQIVGKKDTDFLTTGLAWSLMEDEQDVADKASCINREYEILDHTGVPRFIMTTKVPLKDVNGTMSGLVGIHRDVTAIKKANEHLIATNEKLERALQKVKESREELEAAQAQIIDGEKLQLTGRLAAGIAHEVKNPLAIIAMGMECLTLSAAVEHPEIKDIIQDIHEAIQRANSVIGGLLDFSAPRKLDLKCSQLNTVIEQSLLFVKHDMTKKHIHLEKQFDTQLPDLKLDTNKMKQVFVNLFLNAIHAMPDKGQLTVSTTCMDASDVMSLLGKSGRESIRLKIAPKSCSRNAPASLGVRGESVRISNTFTAHRTAVVVRINDSGSGIPEEHIKSIFEPFFTTKSGGQGHGLGLPVTKQIVDLHGGLIEIKNGLSSGVCVTVAFLADGGNND